ncbi:hypothetical protein Bca52824_090766 [Brassica carinata]|uniref:Uncharacterized protein n=1 Tax=Brassica carinata TaxID=52824 RepID=A0A8X7NYB3_BRACI|nr:hypothetical protein Bca52824_090766 [Brassica carinata]
MIRDYTICNFKLNLNTQKIHPPCSFSGIEIYTVKLRQVVTPDPKMTKKNSSVLCACFASNGNTTFSGQVSPYVCKGTRQRHYALVVSTGARGRDDSGGGEIVTLSTEMTAAEEEKEALQVSMVGHVWAATASGTRTLPIMLDDRYRNTHSNYYPSS